MNIFVYSHELKNSCLYELSGNPCGEESRNHEATGMLQLPRIRATRKQPPTFKQPKMSSESSTQRMLVLELWKC